MGRSVPSGIARIVLRRSGGRCSICGCAVSIELAHVDPVHGGGPTTADNLVALCATCHTYVDHWHFQSFAPEVLGSVQARPFVHREQLVGSDGDEVLERFDYCSLRGIFEPELLESALVAALQLRTLRSDPLRADMMRLFWTRVAKHRGFPGSSRLMAATLTRSTSGLDRHGKLWARYLEAGSHYMLGHHAQARESFAVLAQDSRSDKSDAGLRLHSDASRDWVTASVVLGIAEGAQAGVDEALASAEASGDERRHVLTMHQAAAVLDATGHPEQAFALLERTKLVLPSDEVVGRAMLLNALAHLNLRFGDTAATHRCLAEALSLAHQFGLANEARKAESIAAMKLPIANSTDAMLR